MAQIAPDLNYTWVGTEITLENKMTTGSTPELEQHSTRFKTLTLMS